MTAVRLDFETYSEAGTVFDFQTGRFKAPPGVKKRGIGLVGAYAYAAHPSTDVLCAAYWVGDYKHIWKPGWDNPHQLLEAAKHGAIIGAWNSFFEWCIWNLVCVRRYGWPELPLEQTLDTAAAGLAWSLSPSLEKASAAIFGETEKDMVGKRIMLKLSQPRGLTKNDDRFRYQRDDCRTEQEMQDWLTLDGYCMKDVEAEANIAAVVPPLTPGELEVWKLDQKINVRGVAIDIPTVKAAIKIVEEGKRRANLELARITSGSITSVSQATAILNYVNGRNPTLYPKLKDLRPQNVKEYLSKHKGAVDPVSFRILEIRSEAGGNATAKLYAMLYQSIGAGDRARGQYQFCGAQRTRRWAGRGIQLQNLPRGEVELYKCAGCGRIQGGIDGFSFCCENQNYESLEWGIESVEAVLPDVQSGDYDQVAAKWGNPLKIVAGCLRSLLIAGPGKTLISSDFSAIEAVVMACLAGESWVIDTFFQDGKLYERTAAKITGEAPETIIDYKKLNGKHHPARRLGKVGSLASQFAGGLGAWLAFGAGKFLSNDEIRKAVKAWRNANPAIVSFWYACENAAMNAINQPGVNFPVSDFSRVSFEMQDRALYCILPNGEWLTYLDARIVQRRKLSGDGWRILELCEEAANDGTGGPELELEIKCQGYAGLLGEIRRVGVGSSPALLRKILMKYCFAYQPTIVYMGVGEQSKWVELETYGGKLAENIVQATSRFILSEAMLRVEARGYSIVMHTHDEIISEVPADAPGSIEDFERVMSTMPEWAKLPDGRPWPIKAAGGWMGQRYRK